MRQATIRNPRESKRILKAMFRRAEPNRFQHRLHCVLLVSAGQPCTEVAKLFGDSVRTVQHWVKRYNEEGIEGLYNASRMENSLGNITGRAKFGTYGVHRRKRRI